MKSAAPKRVMPITEMISPMMLPGSVLFVATVVGGLNELLSVGGVFGISVVDLAGIDPAMEFFECVGVEGSVFATEGGAMAITLAAGSSTTAGATSNVPSLSFAVISFEFFIWGVYSLMLAKEGSLLTLGCAVSATEIRSDLIGAMPFTYSQCSPSNSGGHLHPL